ncbi:MAG: M1 family aminopeptidase [Bacteroidota bacterium]|nr:M1 family aminopeptidase [Bacteroidota bacterium]
MKHPFFLFLFLLFVFPYGKDADAFRTLPADTAHFYMSHSFDVTKYQLNLDIYSCFSSPYPKNFSGSEIVTFKVDSTLSNIRLNAVNGSILIDSVGLAGVSFTHVSDTLNILLNHTYYPGQMVSVKIYYKHQNVVDHAFYAGSGFVFTDTPPEGARKWFPCWDRPSDKAFTEITVKVPAAARLGSNGILADSTLTGDTLYYHWVNNQPVATYLVTLSAKMNYLISKMVYNIPGNVPDSIPAVFYYNPGNNLSNIRNLIPVVTDFFSQKFGNYPFRKIGFAVLNSLFPWGGMENQTMINLMPSGFSDSQVIVHEHSHQWFGDLITCGTWADVWLNEGFATFCEALWTEQSISYEAYKNELALKANEYLNENPGWPLYHPEWAIQTPSSNQLYNVPITYDKGACVLHQLRYVIGDSLFFEVMHAYATDTNLTYKNAVTSDFVNKVIDLTGQDLNWFFREWVYEPNHPVYYNVWEILEPGNGKFVLSFSLEQTQTNTVFFKMPVVLKVEFEDGSDTLVKTMNDTNPQVFEWAFAKRPVNVIFDPYRDILLKKNTTIAGIKSPKGVSEFKLFAAQPNPFREYTDIRFNIPEPCSVSIILYDIFGTPVNTLIDRKFEAGKYKFRIDKDSLPAGEYIYNMKAGKYNESRKIVLIK